MGLAQVADMHIVADAGAIGCVVVAPVHRNMRSPARGHLQHQRDQVGFRLVALADATQRIGSGRIEVAQADRAQPIGPVAVGQNLLDHALAVAVGVDRHLRMRLIDGAALGLTEGRSGR